MTDFFGDPDEPKDEKPVHTGFVEGNKFWRMRKFNLGQAMAFKSAQEFLDQAQTYFDWVDDNPLLLNKVFGSGKKMNEKKARAMGIQSLCVHLGISHTTFLNYRKREDDFGIAAAYVQQVMDAYNVEIACSGLGNGNIIGRILGLSDKVMHGNDPDNPLPVPEAVQIYQLPDNGRR